MYRTGAARHPAQALLPWYESTPSGASVSSLRHADETFFHLIAHARSRVYVSDLAEESGHASGHKCVGLLSAAACSAYASCRIAYARKFTGRRRGESTGWVAA